MAPLRASTVAATAMWLAVSIARADEAPPPSEPTVSDDGAGSVIAISLAGRLLELRAPPQSESSAWVGSVHLHRESCGARGWLSIFAYTHGDLGGNQHGFFGNLDVISTAGPRLRWAAGQSVFLRGGLGLSLLAAGVGWAELDLPRLELGYQLLAGATLVDLGADGAVALGWGSLDPWTSSPAPFAVGPSAGGHVHVQHQALRLRLDGRRLLVTTADASLPRDRLQASLCGAVRSGPGLVFCAEAAAVRGEARPDAAVLGSGRDRVLYSMLISVGVGLMGTR